MTKFVHTPYAGSKTPFSVGLAPLDLNDWIEVDQNLGAYLAEKERLFAADEPAVLRAQDDTREAQAEVLALLLEHLPRRFPEQYVVDSDTVSAAASGATYALADWRDAPLALAAQLVQEDLVIMRQGPEGYRLVAAALCFPSSWSLTEKFGQAMTGIHEAVPDFNEGRTGRVVAKIFDNLAVDNPVWRLNWSIYGDDELHHPQAKALDARVTDGTPELYVRVERQTLRRLPESGDLLFTIKVHVDPIAAFATHPDGERLAAGLRAQLLAMSEAQIDYKGLTKERDRIAAALAELAGETLKL
ncbi:MAG: DUF3445 domain-containing protein [Parvibaculum sp.]